jgi:NAD(P)-dependent dehydrogenase (short-subunit alcohol dehydrogenase family)
MTKATAGENRDPFGLSGKTIVVLGAGLGIGRETALRLRQYGARVVCVDIDADRAASVASEVDGFPLCADALEANAVRKALDAAAGWHGSFDGLIDIIGGARGSLIEDFAEDEITEQINLNLRHAFIVTRAASALMLDKGGSISFVGSVAGISSLPRQPIYGATKAALHHFVASAAAELGHRQIRVNAVAPGFVRTPRMNHRFTDSQWAEIAAETPLQRPGEPLEIANILVFLASQMASFVTGQTIVADGGLTLPLKVMKSGSDVQIRGHR